MENLIDNHKKEISNQQTIFENQIELLQKQLNKEIEINKVLNKVENTSKQIDNIFLKFSNEKENQNESNKLYYESLVTLESRLKNLEITLNKDKEQFLKEKEIFEKETTEKMKLNAEENIRLNNQKEQLNTLLLKIKKDEEEQRNKYEKEKLENEKKK